MADEADYTERAESRIREILAEHHAAVPLELEARISEAGYLDSGLNIDPHHVTNALKSLVEQGELLYDESTATRGGRAITTVQPADQRRRRTAITRAAARKRLLYARYLGWATGSVRYPHGLIGPAGEQAVRAGILASETLVPATPGAGEVTRLLGTKLPGPLDSGGFAIPMDGDRPGMPIAVLIEIKNIRGWMYPSSAEVYQVLDKGVVLQQANPDDRVLPVFICRKAQKPLFWMAKQLGFMVIELGTQYAGDVDETALDEVRTELAFTDLRIGAGPSLRVRDRLRRSLPKYAPATEKWKNTAFDEDLATLIHQLRYATGYARVPLMARLRTVVKALGHPGF